MNEEEAAVLRALHDAEESLATVVEKAADSFLKGGRIIYVGAGTSGRIAVMDAAEMPPTFGITGDRFIGITPGGPEAMFKAVEMAEDDEHAAISAVNDLALSRDDIVIGLAASGRTPFVIAAIRQAKRKGVWTCGIANNRNTPLQEEADFAVILDTGPEILTGSTRLKAGTSQKLALNRISTGAMVLAGKVIENLMVDVKATNQKLRERCARILCELSPVTYDEACSLLEANHWSIRAALEQAKAVTP